MLFLWYAPTVLAIEATKSTMLALMATLAAGFDAYGWLAASTVGDRAVGPVPFCGGRGDATPSRPSDPPGIEGSSRDHVPPTPDDAAGARRQNAEGDRDRAIQLRAYELWEESGWAHGRHEEHWRQAVAEIDGHVGGKTAP